MMTESKKSFPRMAPWLLALVLIAAGGALWYGKALHASGSGNCPLAASASERLKPLAQGELAALAVETPRLPPDVSFLGPQGQTLRLADFKGQAVLLNLWATWCVPCRQEMPALDKLQAQLGGTDFEVVAVNVDTRNIDKPKAWLHENGVQNLAYYADPTGKILQVLQKSGHLVGLPTTLLVDASGCEIGLLKGPAAWDSDDALAFMRSALSRS